MKQESVIVTVTGASGVGKTSIVRELLARDTAFRLILSTTTRSSRPLDIPGEYRYVSKRKFSVLEKSGAFLWAVSAHGNRYGTLKSDIDGALADDGTIFLILVIPEAVVDLMAYAPAGRVVPLYVASPGSEVLARRLRDRGDDEETIARRLRDCADWDEKIRRSKIRYCEVRNDGLLEEAVGHIQELIRTIRPGG